jgi:GNAT superfamily N-acetyltransferase
MIFGESVLKLFSSRPNAGFRIRQANREDYHTLFTLRIKSFGTLCRNFYSADEIYALALGNSAFDFIEAIGSAPVLVVEIGGRMIGYLWLTEKGGRELVVDPDYAGKGVGRRLTTCFLDYMRKLGVQEPEIVATLNSVSFYRRMGFVEIAEVCYPSVNSDRYLRFVKMHYVKCR